VGKNQNLVREGEIEEAERKEWGAAGVYSPYIHILLGFSQLGLFTSKIK
jgi:hypothetical protein